MTKPPQLSVRLAVRLAVQLVTTLVLVLGVPLFVSAQGDDPFGGTTTGAGAAIGVPRFDPAAVADPVVEAVRESHPSTVEELAQAAQWMLDYGRADEAKKYVSRLLTANPDVGALAALQRKFGSWFFMRLIRDERLAPEGRQLGQAVMQAGYDSARDPTRLRELADQLDNPSADLRRLAFSDLLKAEEAAIAPLVAVLADPGRVAQHALAKDVLVRLGDPAIEPLIGMLQAPNDVLRVQIIEVLGRLGARPAIVYLVGPYVSSQSSDAVRSAAGTALTRIVGRTPARYDAQQLLLRRARSLLGGALPGKPDYLDTIELWHWDEEQKQSVPRRYSMEDASLVAARRVAGDLYALAPDNAQYRRLYLTALLESEKFVGGLDQRLSTGEGSAHALASVAGVAAVEDVLAHALRTDRIGAAIGAAEVLGDIGGDELLYSEKGQPRALVLALQNGDRRVRFAALEAIFKIDPQQPFVGSNRLIDALGFFINTTGVPRALVAHPSREKARTLAGMLNELGFQADTAATGRAAFLLAAGTGDVEIVLVSDTIDFPRASELIQLLRRDRRTSRLPIGLIARAERLEDALRSAQSDPLTEAFARPYDVSGMSIDVRRLIDRIGRHRVLHAERIGQASSALDHLAHFMRHSENYPFYTTLAQQQVVQQAIQTPELRTKAVEVLGLFATPLAQQALVDVASQNARPLAQRQAAATAFEVAVERRGLLLLTSAIRRQYDRYNQSATLDDGTQNVLGALLDTIEAPTRQQTPAEPSNHSP